VKEPARHGAVQLSRGKTVFILWYIVDAVDESRTLAAVPRRVDGNLRRTASVSTATLRESLVVWFGVVSDFDLERGSNAKLTGEYPWRRSFKSNQLVNGEGYGKMERSC